LRKIENWDSEHECDAFCRGGGDSTLRQTCQHTNNNTVLGIIFMEYPLRGAGGWRPITRRIASSDTPSWTENWIWNHGMSHIFWFLTSGRIPSLVWRNGKWG